MGDLGLKQCDLATRWKKSPQYVSQLLHEDVSVNFTIETMVQLSTLVDRRLVIQVLKRNEVAYRMPPARRRPQNNRPPLAQLVKERAARRALVELYAGGAS